MVPNDRLLAADTAPSGGRHAASITIADGELRGENEPLPARRTRGRSRSRVEPAGFVGSSFMLPNGSWYHGRRES